MYRSAQNNLFPSCNITPAAAHESCPEFWLSLRVGSAGICPWCPAGWLVHALQQHTTCCSHPGRARKIPDPSHSNLWPCGRIPAVPGTLLRSNWNVEMMCKSESWAQFGLVVGVSDNSAVSKIPQLESFWGLGQGQPKVWSPWISPFWWWFWSQPGSRSGLFYTPGDFLQEPGADLCVRSHFQQAASSILWRFLVSFFSSQILSFSNSLLQLLHPLGFM